MVRGHVRPAGDLGGQSAPAPCYARAPRLPEPVKSEALRQALAKVPLPVKGRRKLTPETLGDYLRETKGGWFRLLDFEARFQVNKKTAWGYLNLLLQESVLIHNGEKANRVRYLAPGGSLHGQARQRPGILSFSY